MLAAATDTECHVPTRDAVGYTLRSVLAADLSEDLIEFGDRHHNLGRGAAERRQRIALATDEQLEADRVHAGTVPAPHP